MEWFYALEEWYFSVISYMTYHPWRFWGGAMLIALAIFGIGCLVWHIKARH